jgi:hypothetical protein
MKAINILLLVALGVVVGILVYGLVIVGGVDKLSHTPAPTSVSTPTETIKTQRQIQQDIVNYAAEYDLYDSSNPRRAMAKQKLCDEFGELNPIPDQHFGQLYARICG